MLEHKPTQCDKILKYLNDFGFITSYEAFTDLGVTQLGARIFELKLQGYEFEAGIIERKDRYGEPVRFRKYKLKELQCAQ